MTDRPALTAVEPMDRIEFEWALVLQGYAPVRAAQLAHELPASDGALQMLARHRVATERRVLQRQAEGNAA
ncbi:hypothetical protein [Sphingomonas sp.]|uniref:hypothetical protein n=1 Tax=Sphingomonas sp. TaxID=28214 RepID=UPI003CC560D7